MAQFKKIEDFKELEKIAEEVREITVKALVNAGSGHTAGPLGMADWFTLMYFSVLNHDPKFPEWGDRDRLILSNGHIVPVRYAAMARVGYFKIEDYVKGLRKYGTPFQGHPERGRLPGVETTSGPLGSGTSQAAGLAYAARMDGKKWKSYCFVSDGEQDEGNTWEAVMWAGKNKLGNLICVMDRNNIQIDGVTEDVMPLEPIKEKYEAFNWHVVETSGHNFNDMKMAIDEAVAEFNKPTMIISHNIPGKGVPEIEFDYTWHGKPPKPEDLEHFLKHLRSMGGKIEGENQ